MELIQEPFDEKQIQDLANTVRFQKKKNFKNIEKIEEYLHSFSLNLKDEDMEYEWRLRELKAKKPFAIFSCVIIVLQNVFWAYLASHVSLIGKGIKLFINIGLFYGAYQTFYNPKVKKNEAVMDMLNHSDDLSFTKWEIIQLKLTQQRECQRQFFWYQIWWMFFMLQMMANDTQHYFETKMSELTEEQARLQNNLNHFMVGINLVGVALLLFIANIHWIIMGSWFVLFTTSTSYQVYRVLPDIFTDFVTVQLIIQLAIHFSNYQKIKSKKFVFLQTKKIQSLLREQVQIFQHLPDGAVIHRKLFKEEQDGDPESKIVPGENISVDLRHLNITFQEMFKSYKEKLRQKQINEVKTERKQNTKQQYQEKTVDVENSASEDLLPDEYDENFFLKNVYLQKSPYKIEGKMVKQIEDQPFLPIEFIDAIKEFESGQVYSVLTKDDGGSFNVLSQQAEFSFAERVQNQIEKKALKKENTDNGFLIYIVTQEVLFNEEISTITFFKDITFGVLYEQVKAQQSLETAISSTLQQKMGVPLQTIIQHCMSLENSKSIENDRAIQNQVKTTRQISSLMFCQLKDMQDWNQLKAGKFKKVAEKFLLPECLKDIYEMMIIQATVKGVKLEIIFQDNLPVEVIGDRQRLLQIAVNLTTNALNHTNEGSIRISVNYDKHQQKIQIAVKDTGIGIKLEDQENLFKIFKDSGNIGMGLSISREIANKYNGNVTFLSKYKEGSTFTFSFELEEFEEPTGINSTLGVQSLEILKKTVEQLDSLEILKNQFDELDIAQNLAAAVSPYMVQPNSPRFNGEWLVDTDTRQKEPQAEEFGIVEPVRQKKTIIFNRILDPMDSFIARSDDPTLMKEGDIDTIVEEFDLQI